MVKYLAVVALVLCAGLEVGFSRGKPAAATPGADANQVWVTRSDGAQSCTPGSGTSLEDGAAELRKARVRVLGSRKGDDGKMHAQMCGIPTGTSNAYLIPKDDLSAAVTKGYVAVGK